MAIASGLPSTLFYLYFIFAVFAKVLYSCDIYGVAYTPYRIPDACPTEEEVEEDLQYLFKHSRRVRTYSTGCNSVNQVFLRHASEGNLTVMLGVWINGEEKDQDEIDNLLSALAQYPEADLSGIVVGNEVWFRKTMSVLDIVQAVLTVRHKVRQLAVFNSSEILNKVPVFTVDIIPIPVLVAASDKLAVNIHPFYRRDLNYSSDPEVMAERILEATIYQIDFYRNLSPNKQLVVTEIGWPTASESDDVNLGDVEVSHRFLKKFVKYAKTYDIEYYWFELFDSLWKKPFFLNRTDLLSEFNWGVYEGDRKTPKYSNFSSC
eukprot:g7986.t1